jgi:hypothetical protein
MSTKIPPLRGDPAAAADAAAFAPPYGAGLAILHLGSPRRVPEQFAAPTRRARGIVRQQEHKHRLGGQYQEKSHAER